MIILCDAEPLSLPSLLSLVPSLSGSAVLVMVCYAFYTGKIVRKSELDESKANAAKWEAAAWRLITTSDRAAVAAERATTLAASTVESTNRSGQ